MKITDLQEFYTMEIQPKSLLISVVGDSDRIDLKELQRFGQVTQFRPEQLFNR